MAQIATKETKNRFPKIAIFVALGIFVLDQITKMIALRFFESGPIEVLPFFNFVLVWNHGISFGLFSQSSDHGPLLLSILALLIVGGLLIWLTRITHNPLKIAVCAVIAGALGNVLDRLIHGAVIDFLDFHAFGWHYPAFNIADSAIVLGIAFIFLDSILWEPKRLKRDKDEKQT